MRYILIAFALIVASPALADEPTCASLAQSIAKADAGFPAITPGTERQLLTWRASCAEQPPTGEGDVTALCEAETASTPVFYWNKSTGADSSTGFVSCP